MRSTSSPSAVSIRTGTWDVRRSSRRMSKPFPVYGPIHADGSTPTGLDSCNGHTSATPEFASGIYHYHTTTAVPYISGCFRGTAGTVQ